MNLQGVSSSVGFDFDPALRKLLDELPQGNPDKEPTAEVWVERCPNRAVVPLNTPVHVNFGPWLGAETRLCDVIVHAVVLGFHGSTPLDDKTDRTVRFGVKIRGFITVQIS
jgi:hypothetical protein